MAERAHRGHSPCMAVAAIDVWNRACVQAGQAKTLTLPGDRALAAMGLIHSLAMNGGVLHAVESLPPDELAARVNGYRYFGFADAASILEDIARAGGS